MGFRVLGFRVYVKRDTPYMTVGVLPEYNALA